MSLSVPRVADREFPRPLPARVQADPRYAQRQGLRFDLRQADDGFRPDRLDDRAAFRGRLRAARLQYDEREDDDRAFHASAPGLQTTRFVLNTSVTAACVRTAVRAPSQHESQWNRE